MSAIDIRDVWTSGADCGYFCVWCLWPSNLMMDFNQPPHELGISYPTFHFNCSLIVSLPTIVADNGGVIMHEKLPILPNVAGSQLAMPSGGANGTPLFARAVVSNGRSSNATLLACTSSTVDPPSYATQISNRVTRHLAQRFGC